MSNCGTCTFDLAARYDAAKAGDMQTKLDAIKDEVTGDLQTLLTITLGAAADTDP